MSYITNSFQSSLSTPSPTSQNELAVKALLVAFYSTLIDKFIFGETFVKSVTFGAYSGVSSALSDQLAGYVPALFDLNQNSSIDRILANTSLLSIGGGAALSVFLYNQPYGRVGPTKQALTSIVSQILADYVVSNYLTSM